MTIKNDSIGVGDTLSFDLAVGESVTMIATREADGSLRVERWVAPGQGTGELILQAQVDSLQKRLDRAEEAAVRLRDALADTLKERDELARSLEDREITINLLRANPIVVADPKDRELSDLERRNGDARELLAVVEQDCCKFLSEPFSAAQAESFIDSIRGRIEELKVCGQSMRAVINPLDAFDKMESEIRTLRAAKALDRITIELREKEVSDLKRRNDSYQRECTALNDQLAHTLEHLAKIEQKVLGLVYPSHRLAQSVRALAERGQQLPERDDGENVQGVHDAEGGQLGAAAGGRAGRGEATNAPAEARTQSGDEGKA